MQFKLHDDSANVDLKNNSQGVNGLAKVLMVAAVIFGVLFLLGFVPKILNSLELKKMHEETAGAIPVVHTIIAYPAAATESITLPGNIGAIQYTTINARVDGYLKSRYVDIGDYVKTGQLLAVIDTPTVDQELNQAMADLAESNSQLLAAKANLKEAIAKDQAAQAEIDKANTDQEFANITARRWENMATKGAVSLQSRDEKVRGYNAQTANVAATVAQEKATAAGVKTAEAQVKTAEAQVLAKKAMAERFKAQKGFQNVVAPFNGFIIYRNVDPGALITAGSGASQLELFQLAKIDTLRIYIQVPQTIARYLKNGQIAEVLVPEYPGKTYPGKISNISQALDPASRTRQTEVRINNFDHSLLPGMYAQVKITASRTDPWIKVLGTCLMPRSNKMCVVLVKDNKAHYQNVEIGRDLGDEVEIKYGLKDKDVVVVSPPLELREGDPVQPTPLNDK